MSGTQDYFNTWLKAQQDAYGSVGEMTRKFQQNFSGLGSTGGAMPGFGGAMPGFGGFQDVYAAWEKSVTDALRGGGIADANFIRETLLKSLSSSNAYMKLYELWLPLFKAIQQKGVSPDSFKNLIDPANPCGGGENLMFWLVDRTLSTGTLSAQQASILRANPAVR